MMIRFEIVPSSACRRSDKALRLASMSSALAMPSFSQIRNAVFKALFLLADVVHDFGADGVRARGHQARARRDQAACLFGKTQGYGRCRQAARHDFICREAHDGEFIEGNRRTDDRQRRGKAEGQIKPASDGGNPARALSALGDPVISLLVCPPR